mmetsp:Transcript_48865/g.110897  ORF Transcript_48865/g.110897 Transcript_48865/m.110897 type:complete len:366 (+) Transcript_48865:194-1291(+)
MASECVYVSTGSGLQLLNPLDGTIHHTASPCSGTAIACIGEDFVLSPQRKDASLFAWRRGHKSVHSKCRLAEPLGSLLVSSDGSFCFGGGQSGTLYVWEVWSGNLIRSWHGHHKSVRCLGLTEDGSFLLTGGDDAVVSVWSALDLLDSSDLGAGVGGGQLSVRERFSWADHSDAVTAVHVGKGPGGLGRVATASLDHTVLIYDNVSSRQLLLTVACPAWVSSVALSGDEAWVYAGCGDGAIIALSLLESAGAIEALSERVVLEGHSNAVTGLVLHGQGTVLVSASEDGTVRAWDAQATRQCVQVTHLKVAALAMVDAGLVDPAALTGQDANTGAPFAPLRKHVSGLASSDSSLLPMKRSLCHVEA